MEAYLLQNNLIKSLINAVVILLLNALNIEFTTFFKSKFKFYWFGFFIFGFLHCNSVNIIIHSRVMSKRCVLLKIILIAYSMFLVHNIQLFFFLLQNNLFRNIIFTKFPIHFTNNKTVRFNCQKENNGSC